MRPWLGQFETELKYGQVYSRILYTTYIHQQISPCFLQDLQSEWEKEQMQKSYTGVKSEKRCEVVTVGRRAARSGESRGGGDGADKKVCRSSQQIMYSPVHIAGGLSLPSGWERILGQGHFHPPTRAGLQFEHGRLTN